MLLLTTFCSTMQIVSLCQALNDVLDGMAKKGLAIPVWIQFEDPWWVLTCKMCLKKRPIWSVCVVDSLCPYNDFLFNFLAIDTKEMFVSSAWKRFKWVISMPMLLRSACFQPSSFFISRVNDDYGWAMHQILLGKTVGAIGICKV